MSPRLVALAGPLQGRSFEIAGRRFTIGRDESSDLCIPAESVSRRHCEIETAADGLVLRDLQSLHGTWVNGSALPVRRLAHSDRITVGESTFALVLEAGGAEAPASGIEFDDTEVHATAVLESPPAGGAAEFAELLEKTEPAGSDGRTLAVLLEAAAALQETRTVEAVGRTVLPLLLDAIPGERAALVLTDEAGEPIDAFSHVLPGAEGTLRVSRTVLRRTIQERLGLLAKDLADPAGLGGVASVVAARLHALVCVPLLARGRVFGALYVDTRRGPGRLHETHLRVATALAGLAAPAVESARHLEWLESDRQRLLGTDAAPELLGESSEIASTRDFIARVAPTESTVLLRGESGTGKELAARAIHRASKRAHRPFVVINCAALPEALLESELFGHEKGSFTGAVARQRGKLEVADRGTVFLDEIGELPLALQAKLLRVLEQREFERVGGNRPIRVDLRLIAATNRDLEQAIQNGQFRKDLFYRLDVLSCTLPPLRSRPADIAPLAGHFAALHGRRLNRPPQRLAESALACLVAYDWPGNVRELSNALERAAVFAHDDLIRPEDLPEALVEGTAKAAGAGGTSPFHEALRQAKARLVGAALAESGGSMTEAARRLGLHPKYLSRLVKTLGLKGPGR